MVSNVNLGKPKLKKKPPAQVARDGVRQKEYWKRIKATRQLRVEIFAEHSQLQET